MEVDWDTITMDRARRLRGAARQQEARCAAAWDLSDTPETKAAWEAALALEEDLLVFSITGEKPQK